MSGILQQIAEKSGKPVEKEAQPGDELKAKIKSLREEAKALPPAEAAKRWTELLDSYLTSPRGSSFSMRGYDRTDLSQILMSLPPPESWDDIATLLGQRKGANAAQDAPLQLLMAVLRGDAKTRDDSLNAMRENLKAKKGLESYQRQTYEQYLQQITSQMEELASTDMEKIRAFEALLTRTEKGELKPWEAASSGQMTVPDLVRFTDEKTATALLLRLLKSGPEYVRIEGKTTRLLAASLALKHIDTLKKPLWELVTTLDHAPLYEAMLAKFPEANDHRRQSAAEIYLLALIAGNRTQEAVKLALTEDGNTEGHVSISTGHLDSMNHEGLGKQVLAFLQQLLTQDATLPYWKAFIELSAHQRNSAGALKLLQESLARPSLPAAARAEMQGHYHAALLAADQKDEGVSVLRELVKAGPDEKKSKRNRRMFGGAEDGYFELCVKLATLGKLLDKPELVDEALAAAIAEGERALKDDSSGMSRFQLPSLIDLLLDHGRGPQAEQEVAKRLTSAATQPRTSDSFDPFSSGLNADQLLIALISVYDRTGRQQDVLGVLEQMPYWTSSDLASFDGDPSLMAAVARALIEAGRKEEASRVLRRAVKHSLGKDAIYSLLLQAEEGQPLAGFLDELAKRDRFEERPLIWKARVLLDAGQVAEAEKTVRAAIAIDPSDGEQGKGDRMRAYAILAEVLEKKGDAENAKVMRGAVSAIRKSEDADDWWNAGLLSEAVRRYEAALNDFADAYCIQARLALRYSDMGEFDKSEKHYLRAFELMPDSFGRVESHCFGCEGAFSGVRAQSAAEKVFTRLASLPPVKPQVHYLLGYLRQAQDRPAEAAEAYRMAVKADPDYLNAWIKITQLAEEAQMPREESENATLQIFRLDPAGRHSHPRLEGMTNMRRLWGTLLAAEASLPAPDTGKLLTLTAAKARHETEKDLNAMRRDAMTQFSAGMSRENPRQHLLQNQLIMTMVRFIESLAQS